MGDASQRGGSARGDGNERDVLFELRSHPYRRLVRHTLVDADGPQTVRESSQNLGAWQADLPVADRSATGVDAIESTLHSHLPKMAAAGVIERDRTRDTVTPGARATEVPSSLEEIGESIPPVGHDRTAE